MENIAVNASFVRVFVVPALPAGDFRCAPRRLATAGRGRSGRPRPRSGLHHRRDPRWRNAARRRPARMRGAPGSRHPSYRCADRRRVDAGRCSRARRCGRRRARRAGPRRAPDQARVRLGSRTPGLMGRRRLARALARADASAARHSRTSVVALEFGGPTIVMKASLHGVPAMQCVASATRPAVPAQGWRTSAHTRRSRSRPASR